MNDVQLRFGVICSQCAYAELVPVGADAGAAADSYAWQHADSTGHTTIVLAGLLKSTYYRTGDDTRGEIFVGPARLTVLNA